MAVGMSTSFLPPVAAMASVQQSAICAFGCALPMQPVPDAAAAWRCTGCGCLALRASAVDGIATPQVPDVPDAIADVIAELQRAVEIFADYVQDAVMPADVPLVSFAHTVQIEAAVCRSLGLLRSAPMTSHANAVHAIAIEAAARVCESRARSLYDESHDAAASLEAQKCARAVRRIGVREVLANRPELVAPIGATSTVNPEADAWLQTR